MKLQLVAFALTLTIGLAGIPQGAFSATPPPFLLKWGSPGSGDGEFQTPRGIAADFEGNVYVADSDNHRIQKFTGDGTFILAWGDSGTGDGQFRSPRGVAVDHSNNIYVTDHLNNRVQKFTSGGVFVLKWGTSGTGNGQFLAPRGIEVDDSSHVYVTEDAFVSKRVQKFTDTGGFITKWGSSGGGNGQFTGPRDVATGYRGFVYVSDTLVDRIQKFTTTGNFILKWGQSGTGPGDLSQPIGVEFIADHIYVVEQGNHRVSLFDSGGGFVFEFGSFCDLSDSAGCVDPDGGGPLDLGDGQFNAPQGAAVDVNGNLFVTDTGNNRIQRFGSPDVVGIRDEALADRVLLRVFPNPSSSSATAFLSLSGSDEGVPEERMVVVQVFDVAGRLVKGLFSGALPEGDYRFTWDGSTGTERKAPPGIFYMRVAVDGASNRAVKIVRIP